MSDPLIQNAIALATATLDRFGVQATVAWPAVSGSLTKAAAAPTQGAKIFLGKRSTQIVEGRASVSIEAVMSAVSRNPVGATITANGTTYKVISSDDLGQSPGDIAVHKLVLV